MDSVDVDHVLPPDPANLFWFAVNQIIPFYSDGSLWFQLLAVESTRVYMRMHYYGQEVEDWLNLDKPCVALRHPENNQPMVTITLRKIEHTPTQAAFQLSINQRYVLQGPRHIKR